MHRNRYIVLLLLLVWSLTGHATSKGMRFFYRASERIDRYLLQNVDTNYIALPEHSWNLAFTTTMVGTNSNYQTRLLGSTYRIGLLLRTTPSVDLGFNAGYRGFRFGYSWDVLHAYANNLNLSFGGKSLGIEFQRQVSTNLSGNVVNADEPTYSLGNISSGLLWITNTNLTVWYALNSEHYSHNAAIKQSYIQKKSAGSVLLSLAYLHTNMSVMDTLTYQGVPIMAYILDSVKSVETHQVAIGLGYGINYTPNKGKVVLHLAANAQLVCYSINQISVVMDSALNANLPGEAMFNIYPKFPVHVTGNIRAAVSWEICPWAYLSCWAQANNIRFTSHETAMADIRMQNWNWQVHLNIGVRFGAGKKRVQKALEDMTPLPPTPPIRDSRLPKWITEYFYSPSL